MKMMTVREAAQLAKAQTTPAISLYLTTDVADKDSSNKLRLNLQRLYRTAETLIARTYDANKRERLLESLKKALSRLGLRRAKGGIGIYHSENFTGLVRLPTVTTDLVVAAESFHIKPVLRCVQARRSYYLLALRKRRVELLLVTADGTVEVARVPLMMPKERELPTGRGNKHWLLDGVRMRRQRDFLDAMEQVNQQLSSSWAGQRLPLLLAGPHYLQEAFRDTCQYIHLLERGISSYIEDLDTEALTNLSVASMEHYFAELDQRSVMIFAKAEASGLGTTNLQEIAKAAARGQIQSLLIAEDRHIWGHLDRDTGCVEVLEQRGEANADDLLDDLAELTLNKGGSVTVLPSIRMPKNQLIAAVLRWSDTPSAMPATHSAMQYSWRRPSDLAGDLRA